MVVMPGSGASWPARSGQRRRVASHDIHAAHGLCSVSATESLDQFVSNLDDQPDSEFCREENFVTVDFQQKFCTSKLKSNVPATILFQ